ncbi:MAG: lytic polysaccharide monooxygenase, partial [Defluviitaleaceae bacterium]|nr:lytic polysaccharide monooxygenase [Defluviitaleaceae bacterium]
MIHLIFFMSVLTMMVYFMPSKTAHAHGYVEVPFSRAFRYSNRRGTGSTAMIGNVATEPQSLGTRVNWPTGAGSPQDGRLASANCAIWWSSCPQPIDRQTSTLWDRTTMNVGWNTFTWFYTVGHRTNNWQYFITKPDWNPDAPLTRAQFDLTPIATIQGNGVNPGSNSRSTHQVFIPTDRNGYHLVYAVWNRSDANEAFYQIIDLNLVGGVSTPTPEPEPEPTPQPEPTPENNPMFNNRRLHIATVV